MKTCAWIQLTCLMNSPTPEKLKEYLRAMIAGHGDGIYIDTPYYWVVPSIK
jgi:hypothetical protein